MRKNGKMEDLQIASFCEQIYMVVQAGLTIHQGISVLIDDATDEETKAFLQKIYTPMEQGASLYDALSTTDAFPEYMLKMINMGERLGKLEEVLFTLSRYYRSEAEIKSNIRYAVKYPVFMFLMVFAVVSIIIMKVLPVFANIYESLGTEVTGTAKMLLGISVWLNRYMFVILIVVIVLAIVFFILYKNQKSRVLFQNNKLAQSIALSRFSNCMYLAIGSGLNSDYGLELAKKLIDNKALSAKIEKCRELTSCGEGLAAALDQCDIFPKLYTSWLNISYLTGNVDDTMKKICEEYERDVEEKVAHFISILEPTLVIILSVLIGLVLVSFLLPLLGIMASIGA